MNIGIFQQTKPVGSNQLVMALYKASAPTVLVTYFPLPGAYTGQTQLHTFTGLANVNYKYKLFESPDGSATGTIRNYFDIQPGVNTYATRDDLYLTADISAFLTSGTSIYGPDPSLVGWNWSLERVGQGTREINIKYTKTKAGVDTTKDDTDADGWRLLVDGDVVGPNEEWVIHFLPQLAAQVTSASASVISTTRLLTANISLDNSAVGQSFWLKGGAGYFEVTLPDLSSIPDDSPIYFMSDGGSHINVGLKCLSGQTIQWYRNQADLASDTRASRFVLGQQQKIALYKTTLSDSTSRFLILSGGENRGVGEIVYAYSKIPINTISAMGQLLSRSIYVSLWEHVQSLEAGALIADSAFNNVTAYDGVNYYVNHGKYTTGDGSTTFRVPMLAAAPGAGIGFLRIVDGTGRLAGSFEVDSQAAHQHEGTIGALPTTLFGKGPIRVKGNYNGLASGMTDLSGLPGLVVGTTFQNAQKTSYENRPVNIGVYGLVRI